MLAVMSCYLSADAVLWAMSCSLPTGQAAKAEKGSEDATELIFTLKKYGSGWGEELLPRLVVEQRPIQKRERLRNRSSFPDAWQVRHSALASSTDNFLCASCTHWC